MDVNDDLDEFDMTELLDIVEKAEAGQGQVSLAGPSNSRAVVGDDFDDLDMDALLRAAESAERQHESGHGQIREQARSQSTMTRFFSASDTPRPRAPARQEPRANDTPRSSFGSQQDTDDLIPPPPLPPDTVSYHPIDREALTTWVYPINYPIRLYQLNIVQKALFSNTLVALPTGLGKTFLAAVVMYNYWRWFPTSKIVFTAPTRPLVKQQIEACFKICGLPQSDTIELTGSNQKESRKALWMSKRVFFLTPQIMENDLKSRICPASKIVCLVVDEAHKATGNYAYTEVVRELGKVHDHFRILALSATPGTNLINVQTVLTNLRISNVQIRTEESMDIQEFTFGKSIQTMVCSIENMAGSDVLPRALVSFRDEIFAPVLKRLKGFQALYDAEPLRNPSFKLLQEQRKFSATSKNLSQAVKSMVFVDFSIAISLGRAFEMLYQHGVGPFLSSMDGVLQEIRSTLESGKNVAKEKYKLVNNFTLKRIMDNLREKHAQAGFMGHPKMNKLVNIVLQHLSEAQDSESRSKVIIFSTFRNSVDEIVKVLNEHEPLVRCSSFVGQADSKHGSKGLNQREQQEVISRFRRDALNVLVCTSIAEEGLDIGEVDLIVCYDSQSSPIRMLQRMGRTGRQRRGRCVLLMTDQEERKYRAAKESYAHVQQAIARGSSLQYFKPNASLLPENYRPALCKKKLAIGTYQMPVAKSRKRRADESETILNTQGTLNDQAKEDFLRSFCEEGEAFTNLNQVANRYWPLDNPLKASLKYLPLHTRMTPYKRVGHSYRTRQFVSVIKRMERSILYEGSQSPRSVTSDQAEDIHVQAFSDELHLPSRSKRPTPHAQAHTSCDFSHDTSSRQMDVSDPFVGDPHIPLEHDTESRLPVAQDASGSPPHEVDLTADDADDFGWDDVSFLKGVASPNVTRSPMSEDSMFGMNNLDVAEMDNFLDSLEQKTLAVERHDIVPVKSLEESSSRRPSKTDTLFDDSDLVPPIYPYESITSTTTIRSPTPSAFLWVMSSPRFSNAALTVLNKRQDKYKDNHGHFLALGVYARYTPEKLNQSRLSPLIQTKSPIPTTPSFDEIEFDDSMLKVLDGAASADTEYFNTTASIPENVPSKDDEEAMVFHFTSQGVEMVDTIQDATIDTSVTVASARNKAIGCTSPINYNTHSKPGALQGSTPSPTKTTAISAKQPTEEEVFEWDFDDSMFSDFIENKICMEDSVLLTHADPPDQEGEERESPKETSNDHVRSVLEGLSQSSQTLKASLPASPITKSIETRADESPIRGSSTPRPGTPDQKDREDEDDEEQSPIVMLAQRRRRRRHRYLITSESPEIVSSQSSRHSLGHKRNNSEDRDGSVRAWKRLRRLGEPTFPPSPEEKATRPKKPKRQMRDNPFLDLEAERSDDDEGQSTAEDDTEGDSSQMDSFINDNSSDFGPQLSSPLGHDEGGSPRRPQSDDMLSVYRKSLMSPETLDSLGMRTLFKNNRRPAWIEKLRMEKWNDEAGAEEEDEGEDGEEDEDEDEATEEESIGQFSSKPDVGEENGSDSDFA